MPKVGDLNKEKFILGRSSRHFSLCSLGPVAPGPVRRRISLSSRPSHVMVAWNKKEKEGKAGSQSPRKSHVLPLGHLLKVPPPPNNTFNTGARKRVKIQAGWRRRECWILCPFYKWQKWGFIGFQQLLWSFQDKADCVLVLPAQITFLIIDQEKNKPRGYFSYSLKAGGNKVVWGVPFSPQKLSPQIWSYW